MTASMFRALSAMSFLMTKTLLRRLHMLMRPNERRGRGLGGGEGGGDLGVKGGASGFKVDKFGSVWRCFLWPHFLCAALTSPQRTKQFCPQIEYFAPALVAVEHSCVG